LGTFGRTEPEETPLPCDVELRRWLATYGLTMKHSSEVSARYLIERHLAPHFGSKDLKAIREADLLEFARVKLDSGLGSKTIRNALGVLRRALYVAQREGVVDRNPAARIGQLMRRVDARVENEVREVDHRSREDVDALLRLALEYEARFYPALLILFSTGFGAARCWA
jgi:hypothetical protein